MLMETNPENISRLKWAHVCSLRIPARSTSAAFDTEQEKGWAGTRMIIINIGITKNAQVKRKRQQLRDPGQGYSSSKWFFVYLLPENYRGKKM